MAAYKYKILISPKLINILICDTSKHKIRNDGSSLIHTSKSTLYDWLWRLDFDKDAQPFKFLCQKRLFLKRDHKLQTILIYVNH